MPHGQPIIRGRRTTVFCTGVRSAAACVGFEFSKHGGQALDDAAPGLVPVPGPAPAFRRVGLRPASFTSGRVEAFSRLQSFLSRSADLFAEALHVRNAGIKPEPAR